ncbi:hypothetical protein [Marinobacter xestospongiae]|uniref:hypothetical protein n=1 Tax=Marinobacter xestospongiae TaxID=994319 RepID=UPI002003FC99|nr:hypothetical protein [Marinobacter xestospongiae]MCK7566714.1 hypothetical protein [Marinobacter xestospongiae]
MPVAVVTITFGLILFLSGCAETQYLTKTKVIRLNVPTEYLITREIPGPSRRIDECPVWGEQLKSIILACQEDKQAIIEWSKSHAN